jgi:TonB family protein
MCRRDFPRNLLYGLLALPVAYHPLLWLTRERIAESRELVCDAIAAQSVGGREQYAKSLLSLASMLSHRNAPALLHAIGIFDANIFERRVMHLTSASLPVARAGRIAIAAACGLIALATCTSALALRIGVTDQTPQRPNPATVHVKAQSMHLVSKVSPVYPLEAKKDRLTGTVILAGIIGKDGAVERLDVKKSLRADCDQSALDAVRQWRYEPFLLNGKPVEVETAITITFSLAK